MQNLAGYLCGVIVAVVMIVFGVWYAHAGQKSQTQEVKEKEDE